jgi:hypothetical protein
MEKSLEIRTRKHSRFSKILPELTSHTVEGVLHYLPHSVEDVSDYVDLWKQMMDMHQSQLKTYPYSEWVLA